MSSLFQTILGPSKMPNSVLTHLTPRQRAMFIFFALGAFAPCPFIAFAKPPYIPAIFSLGCTCGLLFLRWRARKGSIAPFILAVIACIVAIVVIFTAAA
jgi:hypothetical protein